jgi:hypothetical protein
LAALLRRLVHTADGDVHLARLLDRLKGLPYEGRRV